MDTGRLRAGWEGLAVEAERELATWRQAHPRASLAEIEAAVEAVVSRLRARYLSDLVHTSAAVDWREAPAEERPRCTPCGGSVQPRGGQQERDVLTPRQAAPLRLRRGYGECSACGAGLFPPG
jgi:hypothetical protein